MTNPLQNAGRVPPRPKSFSEKLSELPDADREWLAARHPEWFDGPPSPVKISMPAWHADLPTDNEVDQLLALVERTWPRLKPTRDEPGHRAGFLGAMRRLVFARRSEKLNADRGLLWFADEATCWLADRGAQLRVSGKAFLSAALVSRIAATAADRFPHDVELALSLGDGHANLAWQETLRSMELLPPLPPRRPPPPADDAFRPKVVRVPSRAERLIPGRIEE